MKEQQVLSGIRILDFSWVLAGPYATRLLADFGAEVIKVHPLQSEPTDPFSRGYYNTWNRNKLSITLNLGHPEGLHIARQLVNRSDAVVENFSPRVIVNWGLDYPELKKIKPDIILLSMSVMGHSGPWKEYTGFGPTVQAFSGISYLTSYIDQPPLGPGFSYSDHVAGLYASLAVLGALEFRQRTGEGQYIDLSQTETMASLLSEEIIDYTLNNRDARPAGNTSLQSAPHGIYPCAGEDRWCAIAVSRPEEWDGFKRAVGHLSWTDDARFATQASRLTHREALDRVIRVWTKKHQAEEVVDILQREGVPSGLVRNAADLASDPQLQARGFFQFGPPVAGLTFSDASPIRLSETPAEYRRPAPAPEQDNDYVYQQLLKINKKEIERLRQEKII